MNDSITIIDDSTQKKIIISFSQYCDLIIGLRHASDIYQEVGEKSRVKDFKKVTKTLESLTNWTMHSVDFDSFDIRDYIEDNWESFLESSEEDWDPVGIQEQLDPETQKLLETF